MLLAYFRFLRFSKLQTQRIRFVDKFNYTSLKLINVCTKIDVFHHVSKNQCISLCMIDVFKFLDESNLIRVHRQICLQNLFQRVRRNSKLLSPVNGMNFVGTDRCATEN